MVQTLFRDYRVWRRRIGEDIFDREPNPSWNRNQLITDRCWLRYSLSFARPFPRLCRCSVTNSTDFLLLFGSGRIALATVLASLTQLLLVQIGLELFIGEATAETSGGNCQCRCNFYWPPTGYHMPRAFRQRIAIRKRKLTTTRSTLMRHNLSYRGRLKSSNAEAAFVRANFTAGRGHAWEGGRAPRSGIEAARVDYHFNV